MASSEYDFASSAPRSGLSLSDLKARQSSKISGIHDALIAAGHGTLSEQAAVLGLSRSTTWAVLHGRYKASGFTAGVIRRILSSSKLPLTVRRALESYAHEKLLGAYGHSEKQRLRFRMRMGYPVQPAR